MGIDYKRFADPKIQEEVREARMCRDSDRDMVTEGMNVITVLLALTLGFLFIAITIIGMMLYGK